MFLPAENRSKLMADMHAAHNAIRQLFLNLETFSGGPSRSKTDYKSLAAKYFQQMLKTGGCSDGFAKVASEFFTRLAQPDSE